MRSKKNVAVLTEDRAFALFFRHHAQECDSTRVPTPGNSPLKAKKHKSPGGGLVQLELTDALSFQFQMNKKELEICEFEMHLKFAL